MGNRTKVSQDSMSRHNMTNPDKLNLVNYNHKICNTEIFQVQNFGRKNFDDSTCTRQIRQTFPPSKFYAIQYLLCSGRLQYSKTITYLSHGDQDQLLSLLTQSWSFHSTDIRTSKPFNQDTWKQGHLHNFYTLSHGPKVCFSMYL